MNNLEMLIKSRAHGQNPPIVQLLNSRMEPVGALYLDKIGINIEDISICESTTSEKYYLFLNGVAIFFSYYKI